MRNNSMKLFILGAYVLPIFSALILKTASAQPIPADAFRRYPIGPTPTQLLPQYRPLPSLPVVNVVDDQVVTSQTTRILFPRPRTRVANLEVSIRFNESLSILLGQVDLTTNALSQAEVIALELNSTVKMSLLQNASFELGEIVLRSNGQNLEATGALPRILVGGLWDLNCSHPILVSDFHHTLDQSEQAACLHSHLGPFLSQHHGVIAILSRGQTSEVRREARALADIGSRVFVVPQSAGYGDKVRRFLETIRPLNACVLGFTSEEPSSEGESARQLGINYWQVSRPAPLESTIIPYDSYPPIGSNAPLAPVVAPRPRIQTPEGLTWCEITARLGQLQRTTPVPIVSPLPNSNAPTRSPWSY